MQTAAKPDTPTYRSADLLNKGQRVLISYGRVRVMRAEGSFATGGRIVSLRHRRRGWYGVEIGWDVYTSKPVLVTAHRSALTVLAA